MASGITPRANAIFQQPWWLDAWRPAGGARRVRARRPDRRADALRRARPAAACAMLTQPPLTQTLGPWVEPSERQAGRARSPDEHELLARARGRASAGRRRSPAVLARRCSTRCPSTGRAIGSRSGTRTGWRAWARGGALGRPARQHPPRDPQGAQAGGGPRRPRARRFYDVCAKTFARQGIPAPRRRWPSSSAWTRPARAHDARRDAVRHRRRRAQVHAVAYVVWDGSAAYYLLGGGDPRAARRAARAACSCGRRSCARAR